LASLLGLTGSTFDVLHSNTGNTSNGELPDILTLNPNNTVTVLTEADNLRKWKTTLNVTNGTFTGSFELEDAGKKTSRHLQRRAAPATRRRQPHRRWTLSAATHLRHGEKHGRSDVGYRDL